jgi:hypothetical protein
MNHQEGQPPITDEEAKKIIERVRARFAKLRGVSLADELIAERRQEAAREEAESAGETPSDQEGQGKQ